MDAKVDIFCHSAVKSVLGDFDENFDIF